MALPGCSQPLVYLHDLCAECFYSWIHCLEAILDNAVHAFHHLGIKMDEKVFGNNSDSVRKCRRIVETEARIWGNPYTTVKHRKGIPPKRPPANGVSMKFVIDYISLFYPH